MEKLLLKELLEDAENLYDLAPEEIIAFRPENNILPNNLPLEEFDSDNELSFLSKNA